LVIGPRRTVRSDSWCFGVRPAQLASCAGDLNLVTSPISATNTEANSGPIPGICLDRLVAKLTAKLVAHITLELCDLAVEDLDQVPERLDAGAIGRGQTAGLQKLGA
jgi:hypothetical protein